MAWIKRHLIFVICGVVALVLLGGAGYFIYENWSRNSDNTQQLNDLYSKLQQLNQSPQQPGNDKVDNIQTAKDQLAQVQDWIKGSGQYFTPIPSIPTNTPLSTSDYAEGLRQTIDLLNHEADAASVGLPPQCNFSFDAQRSRVKFSGELEPLAQQLGEVKVICETLFAARVNDLDGIQRVRVSDDDAQGVQSEYIDSRPLTNDLAIITPYVLTFRCFTPELAKVLQGFSASPYPFIVKSVSVQPAASADGSDQAGGAPGAVGPPYGAPGMAPGGVDQMQPMPGAPPPGKGGLQTILKEQMLRVTMEVDLVKLQPKS